MNKVSLTTRCGKIVQNISPYRYAFQLICQFPAESQSFKLPKSTWVQVSKAAVFKAYQLTLISSFPIYPRTHPYELCFFREKYYFIPFYTLEFLPNSPVWAQAILQVQLSGRSMQILLKALENLNTFYSHLPFLSTCIFISLWNSRRLKGSHNLRGKKLWSWIKRTGSPEFALKWNKLCTKLLWLVPNNFGHSARAKTEFEHTKQENSLRKKTAKNQVSMLHEQETSVSLL